jgi:hypothetical protein
MLCPNGKRSNHLLFCYDRRLPIIKEKKTEESASIFLFLQENRSKRNLSFFSLDNFFRKWNKQGSFLVKKKSYFLNFSWFHAKKVEGMSVASLGRGRRGRSGGCQRGGSGGG